jgi:chemotaxis protein methyltransferase CheR
MSFGPSSISAYGLPLLRDLIHERTGISFDDRQLDMLLDKVSSLIVERGFDSVMDYYYLLRYDANQQTEWWRVMDALSVRETYFWREPQQIRALADVFVPNQIATRPGEPILIWSAACATGEEPLSIAIALEEAGLYNIAEIQICASDASEEALQAAKRGIYRERAVRKLPPDLRVKYFKDDTEGWRVSPELHSRIRWFKANLISEEEVAPLAKARFVFCRNVFIYFSERSIRRTVDLLSQYMPSPGYLFVGAAESLMRITTSFSLQEIGGVFVYVRN